MSRSPPSPRKRSTARPSRLFEPLRNDFAEYLFRRGHSDRQRHGKVCEVRRFVRFLESRGRKRITPLSRLWAGRYQTYRLGELRWRCGPDTARNMSGHVRGALDAFYAFMAERGAVPKRKPPNPTRDLLGATLAPFFAFLTGTRGVSRTTVLARHRPVKRLLRFFRAAGVTDPAAIEIAVIDAFLGRILPGRSRSFASHHIATVRSYLSFLYLTGRHDRDLSSLVELPVSFRAARLPRSMSEKDIRSLLAAPDTSTAKGRRDRAMLLLLAVLGLRPQEVALLCTTDLLDGGAVLRVKGAKDGPDRRFPLPPILRDAIADYLSRDRPPDAPTDRLFLCTRAPWRPFQCGNTLSGSLRPLLVRTGLTARDLTLYALRHAFAQRLFAAETPIGVIRSVMGHRSITTTALYLKIDVSHLREVGRLDTVRRLAERILGAPEATP